MSEPARYGLRVGQEPRWFGGGTGDFDNKTAWNIAASALVAAKVHEAFEWVRYHGHIDGLDGEYHVPTAEELAKVLTDLAIEAMNEPDDAEVFGGVGLLRFVAFAQDQGTDRNVEFYMSIGCTFSDRVEVLA